MSMRKVPVLVTEFKRRNPSRGAPRYRISLVKETGSAYVTTRPIKTSEQVYEVSKDLFEGADREQFYSLCLDLKMKIIGINLVSTGTLSASLVHPREVFKAAILLNAAYIIFVHNHPSGDPGPSRQDIDLTKRLVTAGVLLGIAVRDHVIAGENSWHSMGEAGLVDAMESKARETAWG